MKVIGLTGGIGTGKSTVARFLAELGAVIIDADRVGHEALKPGSEAWRQVVDAFGKEILAPDGGVDRQKLARIVFADSRAREQLNRITHPAMYRMVESQLEEYRRQGTAVVVLDAALLIKAAWTPLVDEVWVTLASEATVITRLRERTGMTEEESVARIRSQLPAEERARRADVVIDTDCSLDEVRARVKALWERLNQ